MAEKQRIVILGGGFGGVYTAMHLEKRLGNRNDFEITLVNQNNYFVYQPMLADIVGGTVGLFDTVSPIRRLVPKTRLFVREVESIDLKKKQVILSPEFTHSPYVLDYDHLVLGLGNVSDFRGSPGIHEHAFPFKNLADAINIRNHIIDVLEAAAMESDTQLRKQLLTFVVGGGGFSGTEVVAEINDFVRKVIKLYPGVNPKEIRVVLVHSKERVLDREMSKSLGEYAQNILMKRGVEIRFHSRLVSASPEAAILDSGEKIFTKTVISTAPTNPNPIIAALELPQEKGKIKADLGMQVQGEKCIWAIGDCSEIPHPSGEGICPPTAQFASRQAKVLAKNIIASIRGGKKCFFTFKGLGMLGALGHHRAVAEIMGIKFSGYIAWLLWRAIYWLKLPGFDRKLRTLLSWTLDLIVPLDLVQLKIAPTQAIAQLHYEKEEVIFNEGDIGDYLYIIVKGKVAVIKGTEKVAELGTGEYFGEMALLSKNARNATIRCIDPTDVLAIKKSDFGTLIANFKELRASFEQTEQSRRK